MLALSIILRLLGVGPYLNANGLNPGSLLVFAAMMGFGVRHGWREEKITYSAGT